jgi:hypothetical protein
MESWSALKIAARQPELSPSPCNRGLVVSTYGITLLGFLWTMKALFAVGIPAAPQCEGGRYRNVIAGFPAYRVNRPTHSIPLGSVPEKQFSAR